MNLYDLKRKMPHWSDGELSEHIKAQEDKIKEAKEEALWLSARFQDKKREVEEETGLLEVMQKHQDSLKDPFDRANNSYEMAGDR